MTLPFWAIALIAVAFAVLIGRLLARDRPTGRDPLTGKAPRTVSPEQQAKAHDAAHDPDVLALARDGKKIEAIKIVRERTGLGLKEAKELVERLPG